MRVPFGIDPKIEPTHPSCSRHEIFFQTVPNPHRLFSGYSLCIFPNVSSFNVTATGNNTQDKHEVLSQFHQVLRELVESYGDPFGGINDYDELFLDEDLSVGPTESWLFEEDFNDQPKLAFIRLEILHGSFGGWELQLGYSYRVEVDEEPSGIL